MNVGDNPVTHLAFPLFTDYVTVSESNQRVFHKGGAGPHQDLFYCSFTEDPKLLTLAVPEFQQQKED